MQLSEIGMQKTEKRQEGYEIAMAELIRNIGHANYSKHTNSEVGFAPIQPQTRN